MTNHEFKVMDWLRTIRDEHSLESINKPWKEIQKENAEAVERFHQRIESKQKKNNSQHQ